MYVSLDFSTYGVRSYSHFWLANSAVQITSELNTSQSFDFACWRWMNCARCWSAEAGNSVRVAFQPLLANFLLNSATLAWASPVVSLPWQYLTVPLGGFLKELASMTFAPLTEPPP